MVFYMIENYNIESQLVHCSKNLQPSSNRTISFSAPCILLVPVIGETEVLLNFYSCYFCHGDGRIYERMSFKAYIANKIGKINGSKSGYMVAI